MLVSLCFEGSRRDLLCKVEEMLSKLCFLDFSAQFFLLFFQLLRNFALSSVTKCLKGFVFETLFHALTKLFSSVFFIVNKILQCHSWQNVCLHFFIFALEWLAFLNTCAFLFSMLHWKILGKQSFMLIRVISRAFSKSWKVFGKKSLLVRISPLIVLRFPLYAHFLTSVFRFTGFGIPLPIIPEPSLGLHL